MILFFIPERKPSRFKIIFLAPLILLSVSAVLFWWGFTR